MPSHALAAGAGHTTLADFRQNVRADVLLEPFNGPDAAVAISVVGSGGYSYNVSSSSGPEVLRRTSGVCAGFFDQGLIFTMTGRPVTAFAGTFRVAFGPSTPANIAGNFVVQTNTGLSFPVSVPAGGAGTFFGFTSTEPFTSVVIADAAGANYEFVDDVYVGTSGTAAAAADQCADAVTISPITAVQYPFTTVGATAETIAGSCSTVDTGPDVWFRFLTPVYGNVTINTCGCTFDSVLRVFDRCGTGQVQIVCNDDFCTGGGVGQSLASQVSFRAEAGEDYLIRVSGYNGASGSGNLSFSVVPDCRADFNHSGAISVQDIFDFLAAYFAGCS